MKFLVLSFIFLIPIAFCETEMGSTVKVFFNNVLEAIKEKIIPNLPQFVQSAKVFFIEGIEMGKYLLSKAKKVAMERLDLVAKDHQLTEAEINQLRNYSLR